jgi:hypothetical protein
MATTANPRLIDVFGSAFTQDDVEFAIPRLQEDIPLYVDPFLLWVSDNSEYLALHEQLIGFFRLVSDKVRKGEIDGAAQLLAGCEEPFSMGLGYALGTKRGTNIGSGLIAEILRIHRAVPQLAEGRMRHIEELQLVVPVIAEDRTSDITCSVLKSFFLNYTADQASRLRIPTRSARLGNIYDPSRQLWAPAPETALPYNPTDGSPILFAPLKFLRHLPWINYTDYYKSAYACRVLSPDKHRKQVAKAAVLAFNARNYVEIERYVDEKERTGDRCVPDPLFKPLAPPTIKSKFHELRELALGSSDKADRRFEDLINDLYRSLFYPTLEFAESRVRTISGAHIRDLIFYNAGKNVFWKDLRDRYDARQPVFELKNVKTLETEHVNQLHRYLDEEFGRFGVIVTRNPAPPAVQRNLVDLHSSKRVAILCIDDRDLKLMISVLESNGDPTDVVKKKFIEFTRLLPK